MFAAFADFDRTFAAFDALQRQAVRQQRRARSFTTSPLRYAATESADAWTVTAELPGVAKEAVEVVLLGTELTIKARRTPADVAGPDGDDVVTHKSERPTFSFEKTITLPHKIDGERVTASMEHGVFTVTLPKAADAKPRQIAVR
ncbi:MAG TPA: Hsp20/alpha crystallin family protein [Myxococcota bacterium]